MKLKQAKTRRLHTILIWSRTVNNDTDTSLITNLFWCWKCPFGMCPNQQNRPKHARFLSFSVLLLALIYKCFQWCLHFVGIEMLMVLLLLLLFLSLQYHCNASNWKSQQAHAITGPNRCTKICLAFFLLRSVYIHLK